jgi:hypothetical protein
MGTVKYITTGMIYMCIMGIVCRNPHCEAPNWKSLIIYIRIQTFCGNVKPVPEFNLAISDEILKISAWRKIHLLGFKIFVEMYCIMCLLKPNTEYVKNTLLDVVGICLTPKPSAKLPPATLHRKERLRG